MILIAFGASSGALLGAAKAIQPWAQSEKENTSTLYHLDFDPPPPFVAAALVLEEAVPPVLTRAKPGLIVRKRVVTSRAGNAAVGVTTVMPGASAPATACERLEDPMINWLLELVAKTTASNPDLAVVAAGVEQQLRSGMGRNMCAEEAQAHVAAMCQQHSVVNFMQQMVRELPFFVRPLVGDPCKADLVAAAKKWLN